MHLDDAELARLERMLAEGRVTCEPTILSATDRMMDAMAKRAREKARARPDIRAEPEAAREDRSSDDRAGERRNRNDSAAEPGDTGLSGWNVPRSLDELIDIRRTLLRSERLKP
jgi:hypothetical protein